MNRIFSSVVFLLLLTTGAYAQSGSSSVKQQIDSLRQLITLQEKRATSLTAEYQQIVQEHNKLTAYRANEEKKMEIEFSDEPDKVELGSEKVAVSAKITALKEEQTGLKSELAAIDQRIQDCLAELKRLETTLADSLAHKPTSQQ